MKKVFNVFTSLDFGGVETHAKILSKKNKGSGFVHSFMSLTEGGATEKYLRNNNSEVYILNKKATIPSVFTIIYLYNFFKLHKPDIVHARGAEACFHALIAAYFAGVKVRIGEEIGIPNHSSLAKYIFKWVYRCASKVIAISEAVKDWLVVNNEVPVGKVIRIYNPVDFKSPIESAVLSTDVFKIGFVGRLEPVKNPVVLVEVLKLLRDKGIDAEVHFVGDGSLKQDLVKLAESQGTSDYIYLHGFKDKPEEVVFNCNIYVQPSISEGFGIALVEAMGLGVPVIASSVGGVPEIIDHGTTGWLLEDLSVSSVLDVVESTYNLEPFELKGIGIAGRNSVINRFTLEQYMTNLDGLYEKLLHNKD